jgi:hypothetical protein
MGHHHFPCSQRPVGPLCRYGRLVPDARCPTCRQWAPRQDWQSVPAGSFPFTIRCPSCGAEADVGAVGYRMTTTPASTLPDAWAAGQGIPGQRPTRHQ